MSMGILYFVLFALFGAADGQLSVSVSHGIMTVTGGSLESLLSFVVCEKPASDRTRFTHECEPIIPDGERFTDVFDTFTDPTPGVITLQMAVPGGNLVLTYDLHDLGEFQMDRANFYYYEFSFPHQQGESRTYYQGASSLSPIPYTPKPTEAPTTSPTEPKTEPPPAHEPACICNGSLTSGQTVRLEQSGATQQLHAGTFGQIQCGVSVQDDTILVKWENYDKAFEGLETYCRCNGPNKTDSSMTFVACGDVAAVSDCRPCSAHSCESLGLSVVLNNICADSDMCNNKCCSGELPFADAEEFCSHRHMRLCTREEVQLNMTANTGCAYDYVEVWTETVCDTVSSGGESSHWIPFGENVDQDGDVVCASDESEHYVRCCADEFEHVRDCCEPDSQATPPPSASPTTPPSSSGSATATTPQSSSESPKTTTSPSGPKSPGPTSPSRDRESPSPGQIGGSTEIPTTDSSTEIPTTGTEAPQGCGVPDIPFSDAERCRATPTSSSCEISCNEGYDLSMRHPYIYCDGDGEWLALPTCEPGMVSSSEDVYCNSPQIEHSNSETVCVDIPLGGSCHFECDDGFQITSRSSTIYCGNDGDWLSRPQCIPGTCSTKTCSELRLPSGICSLVPPSQSSDPCFADTFAQAVGYCHSRDMRLCSEDELNGVSSSNGCSKPYWSSTNSACEEGFWTALGSSRSSSEGCAEKTRQMLVRCCGDLDRC